MARVRVQFVIDPEDDDLDLDSYTGLTPLAATSIRETLEEEFQAKHVEFIREEDE